jgi:hypothetical protein
MPTKNCLLIGCGSKFGLELLEYLIENGYYVHSISGSKLEYANVNHLQINWKTLNVAQLEKFLKELPELNLVFFNQNSSALNSDDFIENKNTIELWQLEKNWGQSYFVSCILPFHIIHTLKSIDKVVWMLSPLVYHHHNTQIGFADYIGNKYQNYLILKNFSKQIQSICIGLNPDKLLSTVDDVRIINMVNFIESVDNETSGRVFFLDGTEDTNFNKFNND